MTPKLDNFTQAYIEAALWAEIAYGSPQEDEIDPPDDDGERAGTFDQSFQDCGYGVDNLSPELLEHVIKDCVDFQSAYREFLKASYVDVEAFYYDIHAGHDFWLTRNSHGAGFWDRDLLHGQPLTDAAHMYGEESWYVSAKDNLIYAW